MQDGREYTEAGEEAESGKGEGEGRTRMRDETSC